MEIHSAPLRSFPFEILYSLAVFRLRLDPVFIVDALRTGQSILPGWLTIWYGLEKCNGKLLSAKCEAFFPFKATIDERKNSFPADELQASVGESQPGYDKSEEPAIYSELLAHLIL